jgi:hypothetical protein
MRFKNQPNLKQHGFDGIRVIYASEFWPSKKAEKFPNIAHITTLAENKLGPDEFVCIDIEHWPLDIRRHRTTAVKRSIAKHASTIATIRAIQPEKKIGIYSMFPLRDYHTPTKNKNVHKWEQANTFLNPIAQYSDVIYPSLYTFYDDPDNWKKYAVANINEAKKYGKTVIAFVWPQYHGSNKAKKYKFIDYKFWLLQLQVVYQHADGIVIWSPGGTHQSAWNPEAEWWQATKDFIQKNNLIQK